MGTAYTEMKLTWTRAVGRNDKKLSYGRETARQLHTSFSAHSLIVHYNCTSLSTASVLQLHVYNRLVKLVSTLSANKPCDMRILSWIGHSRSFQVILVGAGRNAERCVVVMCNKCGRYFSNVYGDIATGNGKVVDFSDPTQVWWRPGKKLLRITTNDLYCQKLESLTYILAAGSVGLSLLLFTQLSLEFEPLESKPAST